MNRYHTNSSQASRGQEGAALMSAIVAMFVVALLVTGYMSLTSSEYRLATRSFSMGASFSLAEGGVDLAMDALNDNDSSAWDVDGTTWTRTVTGLEISKAGEGAIRVVILNATGSDSDTPTILSEGILSGHPTGDLTKQLKVEVEKGLFLGDAGLLADRITNSGNRVSVNAFDSELGDGEPGAALPDGTVTHDGETLPNGSINQFDTIQVSTTTLEGGAIDVGNSDIFGFIATGGGEPYFGPQGGVYSLDDPTTHDPSRITYDFYAELEPVAGPDGTWIPNFTEPAHNTPLPTMQYELDADSNDFAMKTPNDSQNIIIDGDVEIWVTDGAKIALGGDLTITEGSSLTIYTNGDVDISGEINNSNTSENLAIYGTNTTDGEQNITLNGSANLTAFVYAPTANVKLNGGGGNDTGIFQGAIIGYEVVMTGNIEFWYDLALGRVNLGVDDYDVIRWMEMTNTTSETRKVPLDEHF